MTKHLKKRLKELERYVKVIEAASEHIYLDVKINAIQSNVRLFCTETIQLLEEMIKEMRRNEVSKRSWINES